MAGAALTTRAAREPRTGPPKRTRRDATENRDRLLAVAATAVLRDGTQVPLAQIADAAGVGIGTLYRHYPDRDALLAALTERSFALVRDLAAAVAEPDRPAIEAVAAYFEGSVAHRNQLVLPLHGGPDRLSERAARLRDEVHDTLAALIERGRADHTIRADVTADDLVAFGALLVQPLSPGPGWTARIRRQQAIYLAGLAPGPAPLDPP